MTLASSNSHLRPKHAERLATGGTSCALQDRTFESHSIEHPGRPCLDLGAKRWLQQHFPPALESSARPPQRCGEACGAYRPDFPEGGWTPAKVPSDVREGLLERGVMADLYSGRNLTAWRWVEEQEWWMRCRFRLPRSFAPVPGHQGMRLCVNGVTRPATFWLDGQRLGDADDPRVHYRFHLPARLAQDREHLLAVRFAAPREPHEWNGADPSLPDLNPIGFSDCIWLERLPVTRVSDAQLSVQLDPGHERATLTVRLNPETDRPVMERLRMRFTVTDLETGKAVVQLDGSAPWRVPAKPVELAWSNPKLWWPNGAGRPALYRLDCDTR